MIVVYREQIEDNSLFGLVEREHIRNVEYSTINEELDKIRIDYGEESELIHGRLGNSVCIVYDRYKFFVVKVWMIVSKIITWINY